MKLSRFLAVLFLLVVNNRPSHAQSYLNLDFETVIGGLPYHWAFPNSNGRATVDSIEKVNGRYSLQMTSSHAASGSLSIFNTELILKTGIVGDIRLKGKIKIQPSDAGQANLFLIGFDQQKTLGEGIEQNRVDIGTSGWQEVDIALKLDSPTNRFVLGGFCQGQITAWFDDLELFINGNKHDVPELRSDPLTVREVEILKSYCYPLKSYEPSFEDQDDLHILKKLWGKAKILGLGEESHGTSEVYKMKHRLAKYFAENKIFNRLSFEANMPEAYQFNELIQKGEIDDIDIREQLHFSIYDTHEFKDIIKWIASISKDKSAVEFSGFDMQFVDGAITELNDKLKHDEKAISAIQKLEKILNSISDNHYQTGKLTIASAQTDSCSVLVQEIRDYIIKDVKNATQKGWLLQSLRIIEQYLDDSELRRDKYMAENLAWLLEQNKKHKILASGHNGHITKTETKMGYYLSQKYKDDYIAVGTTFHEGSYRAGGVYDAETSFPGTYEYLLNSIDIPIFVLDLKRIKKERPSELEWLLQPGLSRFIGAKKRDFDFMRLNLSEAYDYLIFIKQVSPTKMLR